jgi:uncharacterized protein (DUF305 family)
MAELALIRARRPEIKALAQRIITSQSHEITQMRQWYRQWYGTDVPAWGIGSGYGMGIGPGMGMGHGMGMGGGMGMGWGMPGMATSLEALKTAPDFDRAFIEQMIPHHRMGVMMASHAEWNTQHPQLRELEAAMVRVQSQEIEQMAQWYQQWFRSSTLRPLAAAAVLPAAEQILEFAVQVTQAGDLLLDLAGLGADRVLQ